MRYFFVPPEQITKEKITIIGTDVRHITSVLRLRPGDNITVLNGLGKGYIAKLSSINKHKVECFVIDEFLADREPSIHITLVQGLPKGDKMEMIVQKCTELGVKEFIPLCSSRCVVRLSKEKLQQKKERWERIALEASKQCHRGAVPRVFEPMNLADALSIMPEDALGLIPWEEEKGFSLKKVLKEDGKDKIFLFIGPEGGFSLEEVALAKKFGVSTVSLGKRILRTETAGIVTSALILYEFGDLGEL